MAQLSSTWIILSTVGKQSGYDLKQLATARGLYAHVGYCIFGIGGNG
jgi:hypothetical protein